MKQEMAIVHDQRGFDNYRSVCAYEYVSASVCACGKEKVPKCISLYELHSKKTIEMVS